MELHQLRPPKGARRKRRRVGRGDGSGHGSYSGRGVKGQKARSGGGVRPGFQGGQTPLYQSLPRIRGFTNIFRQEYHLVNLDRLNRLPANTQVTPELMVRWGLVKDARKPIKVLGRGEIQVPLTVTAHKFSKTAAEKIRSAGGEVREIS